MPILTRPASPTHVLPHARFTSLATPSRGGTVESSIWQVELLPDSPAAPHRLTREEVFVVLDGEGSVTLDGTQTEVRAGDVIVVPAGIDFTLQCAGPTPLQAICCLPVGGQAVLPGGERIVPPWSL